MPSKYQNGRVASFKKNAFFSRKPVEFLQKKYDMIITCFLTKGQSGSMGLYFLQSAYFFQGNANALGSRRLVKFLQEKHDIVIMFF